MLSIAIEHTPDSDVFNDQSGRGGVDCDILIDGTNVRGERLILVIETKFVEVAFSAFAFRQAGRAAKDQAVCPQDVPVSDDRQACLYARKKKYGYWQRTDEHGLLRDDALGPAGCPFGGGAWQLWVNLALAHEEARRRGATDVRLAVCTSAKNDALLENGIMGRFGALLQRPNSVLLIDLEELLASVASVAPRDLAAWSTALSARYRGI